MRMSPGAGNALGRGMAADEKAPAMDQGGDPADERATTVGVGEAADLLGQSPDAVLSALGQRSLAGWRDGQGEWRIPIANLPAAPDQHGSGPHRTVLDLLHKELDRLHAELRQARDAAEQALRQVNERQATIADLRVAIARSEERIKAVEAVALADVATAQADAAAKEQLIDELRASVAWHRVPGWRRWLGKHEP
jgi:hypothetical protein